MKTRTHFSTYTNKDKTEKADSSRTQPPKGLVSNAKEHDPVLKDEVIQVFQIVKRPYNI